jgi:hypothetical protein
MRKFVLPRRKDTLRLTAESAKDAEGAEERQGGLTAEFAGDAEGAEGAASL